jgi:hypothetical protein
MADRLLSSLILGGRTFPSGRDLLDCHRTFRSNCYRWRGYETERTRLYAGTRSHLCGSDSSAVAGAPTRERTAHASGLHLHLPTAQAALSIQGCESGVPSSILLSHRAPIVAYRPHSASRSIPTRTARSVRSSSASIRSSAKAQLCGVEWQKATPSHSRSACLSTYIHDVPNHLATPVGTTWLPRLSDSGRS